jgi:hypothetical protein
MYAWQSEWLGIADLVKDGRYLDQQKSPVGGSLALYVRVLRGKVLPKGKNEGQ